MIVDVLENWARANARRALGGPRRQEELSLRASRLQRRHCEIVDVAVDPANAFRAFGEPHRRAVAERSCLSERFGSASGSARSPTCLRNRPTPTEPSANHVAGRSCSTGVVAPGAALQVRRSDTDAEAAVQPDACKRDVSSIGAVVGLDIQAVVRACDAAAPDSELNGRLLFAVLAAQAPSGNPLLRRAGSAAFRDESGCRAVWMDPRGIGAGSDDIIGSTCDIYTDAVTSSNNYYCFDFGADNDPGVQFDVHVHNVSGPDADGLPDAQSDVRIHDVSSYSAVDEDGEQPDDPFVDQERP